MCKLPVYCVVWNVLEIRVHIFLLRGFTCLLNQLLEFFSFVLFIFLNYRRNLKIHYFIGNYTLLFAASEAFFFPLSVDELVSYTFKWMTYYPHLCGMVQIWIIECFFCL